MLLTMYFSMRQRRMLAGTSHSSDRARGSVNDEVARLASNASVSIAGAMAAARESSAFSAYCSISRLWSGVIISGRFSGSLISDRHALSAQIVFIISSKSSDTVILRVFSFVLFMIFFG